ncbi:hypothetical protein CYMTET_20498 [Cymbomonas tetramitiformis]|uniref:Reverse transcriptase domain-containing protein n=1 Tax=Cymbomonas tetramitiformis TaxID=36881 RepID=A0AAE0G427_9CHLO|nr:hypothetical protein CYMTET_20498 [Cymbomonas tetramitiformis]
MRMVNKKTPGADGVSYEILKFIGWACEDVLLAVLNTAYEIGYWPPSLMEGLLVCLLFKGGDKEDCRQWRSICLSQLSSYKVFAGLLNDRMQSFNSIMGNISVVQKGFVKGVNGTAAQVAISRALNEIAARGGRVIGAHRCDGTALRPLRQAYVDYQNAFGSLEHRLVDGKR